jgi:DNA-binding transcriptional LysR family regulator
LTCTCDIPGSWTPNPSARWRSPCTLIRLPCSDRSVWTFVGQRGASIRIDGSFDSNSALALRKAAVAGMGIALLPEQYIAAELTSGTLLRVLPQHEVRRPATALYARSPHIPQKVRLLVSFLVQWFKNERARSYA